MATLIETPFTVKRLSRYVPTLVLVIFGSQNVSFIFLHFGTVHKLMIWFTSVYSFFGHFDFLVLEIKLFLKCLFVHIFSAFKRNKCLDFMDIWGFFYYLVCRWPISMTPQKNHKTYSFYCNFILLLFVSVLVFFFHGISPIFSLIARKFHFVRS